MLFCVLCMCDRERQEESALAERHVLVAPAPCRSPENLTVCDRPVGHQGVGEKQLSL